MPGGKKLPESGSKGRLESKITPSLSTSQPVDPKSSSLLLTVENVKKLQEDSASKSTLSRQSIEAYITESNLFLNQSEASTDQSKEQNRSVEKVVKATSCVPYIEETCEEDFSEIIEQISKKSTCILFPGSQTRSPSSSVLETQASTKGELPSIKCGVTDVETQTEWSYSDDLSSEGKRRRKLALASKSVKESREGGESEEIIVRSILERKEVPEQESFASEEDESENEDHSFTDLCHLGCCEFCTAARTSLLTAAYLDEKPDKMESMMCCRTYKDVFQCVVQELMETSPRGSEIDISPHPHLSNGWMESKTKKTLVKEIEDKGGIEQYREVFEQYIKFGPCMKVRFKLADYPPKPKIVRKKDPEPKELLTMDLDFKPEQLKICHLTKPVKRYYSDGKIFYIFFPDGTEGQPDDLKIKLLLADVDKRISYRVALIVLAARKLLISYPSGNVAVLITYVKDVQFTYIVLQDNQFYEMQACFANRGFAVCYHRNGKMWLNLDLCFGSYFDRKGIRKKHWNWWNTSSHVHAPPFQPIYIQLNVYIQVKIVAQDQIFLTFTNNHDCLQLNVGAKLKLKDPNMLKFIQRSESSGQLVSSKILLIRRLLTSIQKLLQQLCFMPPEETHYFSFIISGVCDQIHSQQKMRMRSLRR